MLKTPLTQAQQAIAEADLDKFPPSTVLEYATIAQAAAFVSIAESLQQIATAMSDLSDLREIARCGLSVREVDVNIVR